MRVWNTIPNSDRSRRQREVYQGLGPAESSFSRFFESRRTCPSVTWYPRRLCPNELPALDHFPFPYVERRTSAYRIGGPLGLSGTFWGKCTRWRELRPSASAKESGCVVSSYSNQDSNVFSLSNTDMMSDAAISTSESSLGTSGAYGMKLLSPSLLLPNLRELPLRESEDRGRKQGPGSGRAARSARSARVLRRTDLFHQRGKGG